MMVAVLALPQTGMAADTLPPLEQSIGIAASQMFLDSGAPGMIIAVVRKSDVVILGYGETQAGNGRKPDGASLVRVNSLSKTLAADLLVTLAEEGRLGLSDPLQKYAPPNRIVPVADKNRPITLLDLATHTSGVPRFVAGQPPKGAAAFTWPDKTTRWQWLVQEPLVTPPGTAALYSNAGYDFLADALEDASKTPYAKLLREKITKPLNMRDTTATPTKEQCTRLMISAGPDGNSPCADTTATAGSGGLYSTASDVAAWMSYQLGTSVGHKSAHAAIAHATYLRRRELVSMTGLDIAGEAAGVGLAWVPLVDKADAPTIIQKTGAGAGFMSYTALAPGRQIGVFVAATKVDLDKLHTLTDDTNRLIATLAK